MKQQDLVTPPLWTWRLPRSRGLCHFAMSTRKMLREEGKPEEGAKEVKVRIISEDFYQELLERAEFLEYIGAKVESFNQGNVDELEGIF